MKVIAKAIKGQEFMYSSRSAHYVNPKNAEKIKEALNMCKYLLKDGETWFLYDIDEYDRAYDYAQFQKFWISQNGSLKEKSSIYY